MSDNDGPRSPQQEVRRPIHAQGFDFEPFDDTEEEDLSMPEPGDIPD